jgi:hypothetical protein
MFYTIVVRVTHFHTVPLSDIMQRKLVQWLHNLGELKAAIWFQTYWTGERGKWAKAHSVVGGTNNTNGTEGGGGLRN